MEIHFTARRFKPHAAIRKHAVEAIRKLDKFYDGIARSDVILSFERTLKSVKAAEINLHVDGTVLTAKDKSDDFYKSIDLAVGKLERQLAKYKMKLRMKNKKTLRRVKEDSTQSADGEEE
jgi:ribosome hibernation promoting factor